jgi:acyl-CoA thioesterase II
MSDEEQIELPKLLDLEPIEVNLFRGISPKSKWPRVFGGQVIGQAMVAACRTVEEGRLPHSLHAYFILAGDPTVPIIYEVGRLRDGRSFSTRRVQAIQHGSAIFSMIVSFAREEKDSFVHQETMPNVPPPEAFSPEKMAGHPLLQNAPSFVKSFFESDRPFRRRPVELRPVEFERYVGAGEPGDRINFWIRVNAELPDDPRIHQCALAYASDMALLDSIAARHGKALFGENMMAASLDHALWFHRPFKADDWMLYSQDSPSAKAGRGLARGLIFTRDGVHVATVAQEGLIRLRTQPPTSRRNA